VRRAPAYLLTATPDVTSWLPCKPLSIYHTDTAILLRFPEQLGMQ